MRFNSDKFTWNYTYCDDMEVSLLWGEDEFIEYGLTYEQNNSYDGLTWKEDSDSQPEVMTLHIVHNVDNKAKVWTNEKICEIENWLITDDFKPFISDDNCDIVYYMKVSKIRRRFNYNMQGWLEVDFQPYSNSAYRNEKVIMNGVDADENNLIVYNIYNENYNRKDHYPITELRDIETDIEIINMTTNRRFTLTDISGCAKIDHQNNTILDDEDKNLLTHSNRKWLKLTPGMNKIKVKGVCKCVLYAQFEVRI